VKVSREVVIGLLAVLSIMLIAVESTVSVSPSSLSIIYAVDFGICVVFAVDFVQRLRAESEKTSFLKGQGYEVLAMIPALALQLLGGIPGLSVGLRSLRLIRVTRVILVVARLSRAGGTLHSFVRRSHLLIMVGITVGIVFVGAFAALLLEANAPGAKITNASDAMWWSLSTVTTVGYRDIVPATTAGRVLGMVLMVIRMGVISAFIAQVGATIVESRLSTARAADDLRSRMVAEMKRKLDDVERLTDAEVDLLVQTINTLRTQEMVEP